MTPPTKLILEKNGREYIHTLGIPVTTTYARAFCSHTLPTMKLKEIQNPAPPEMEKHEQVWRS